MSQTEEVRLMVERRKAQAEEKRVRKAQKRLRDSKKIKLKKFN
jgi:hypothetical protein